jgi:G:T/U-mismatch repair DNA glycosylase
MKKPFLHTHPYGPFLFEGATKLIVGTLPPPRFTTGELKEGDVDFCYGSRDGQLWPILDRLFGLNLRFETTEEAVQQRIHFLRQRKIGICDIVASSERYKMDASDLGMQNTVLRNLVGLLEEYPSVHTLLFTGGNSKNGPEYLFRKHLREHGLALRPLSGEVPRVHEFTMPINGTKEVPGTALQRKIRTVSLTAPSGAANRAVGSLAAYKELKKQYPEFTTIDFRVLQYKQFF